MVLELSVPGTLHKTRNLNGHATLHILGDDFSRHSVFSALQCALTKTDLWHQ